MSGADAVKPDLAGSYRLPRLAHAHVGDVMRSGVFACPPATSLRDAARTMATHHIHSLVVTGESPVGDLRAWAMVSDVDLIRAARGEGTEELSVGDIAAGPALTVTRDDTLEHAAHVMSEHGVAHLIVVDRDADRPIGMLSTLDIAGSIAWGNA
jgi:CBS domain-containing protein